MNHIRADEAEEAPEVVLGILPVNHIPAKVLFDTGASHSFASQAFAQMHDLSFESMSNGLSVTSPGVQMYSSKISPDNEIQIGGHIFLASLIILGNSDIDVILGMDWLKANQAKIDCSTKTVTLSHPSGQIVYSPNQTSSARLFALNVDPLPSIEAIPVVRDFPDVFPE